MDKDSREKLRDKCKRQAPHLLRLHLGLLLPLPPLDFLTERVCALSTFSPWGRQEPLFPGSPQLVKYRALLRSLWEAPPCLQA